jgi:(d)CTP diphosphatase
MARHVQKDGRVHGVVVMVKRDDGRWLCIRRSATVPAPLKVCFPGGGIEAGETQQQAVVREMREELGLTVRPARCLWRWENPVSALTLWGWTADYDQLVIHPADSEVAEVLWLTETEATEHPDAMPSMKDCVAALVRNTEVHPILPA